LRSFLRDLLNQRLDAAVISEQAVPRPGVAHVHPPQGLKRRFRGGSASALPSGGPLATDRTDTSTPKRAGHGPNPLVQRPIGGCSESSFAGATGRFQVFSAGARLFFFPGTKDRHRRPGATLFAPVPRGKRNLPTFPLNRLFSSSRTLAGRRLHPEGNSA
jgi:hypothetical protein